MESKSAWLHLPLIYCLEKTSFARIVRLSHNHFRTYVPPKGTTDRRHRPILFSNKDSTLRHTARLIALSFHDYFIEK